MAATLFPFKPVLPYKQSIEWLTDVLAAYSGGEQRIRVRHAPRHGFSTRIIAGTPELASRVRAFIAQHQASMIGCPGWHDASVIAAGVGSGVSSISFDTTESEYYAGAYAVVWEDDETCEYLEIESVAAGGLTLASPTTQAYASGVLVMPMYEAYFKDSIDYDDMDEGKTIFLLEIDSVNNNVLTEDHWSSQVYLGSRVMTDSLLLSSANAVPRSFTRPREYVDFGTGAVEVFDKTGFSFAHSKDYRWVLNTRADIWKFRQWLSYMAGQLNTVWIPSFTKDLELTGAFLSSDVQLFITPYGYVADEAFSHLAFMRSNGTVLCREVSDWTANTVTIDSGLGFGGTMADFDRISFLRLYRFATDKIELDWETQDRVQAVIPVRTVYEEESA